MTGFVRVHPLKKLHWAHSPQLMWVVAMAFVLLQFSLQLSTGIMLNQLIHSFHLSALGAGFLSSIYFITYVGLQTPIGIIVDRFGPRRTLSVGAFICGLGLLVFACSQSFLIAILGRILMGIGCSGAFVCTLQITADRFNPNRYTFYVAMLESICMLGSLLFGLVFAELLEHHSWRHGMMVACIIAFGLSALSWLIIRDLAHDKKPLKFPEFFGYFKKLIGNSSIWLNGIYGGILFSIITAFSSFWGLIFLIKAEHLSTPSATFYCSFVLLGAAIGAPLFGLFYHKVTHKRRFVFCHCVTASILMAWLIQFAPQSLAVNLVILFVLGYISMVYLICYPNAKRLANPEAASTAIGFTNTLCVITAPLLQVTIGWLIDLQAKMIHPAQVLTGQSDSYAYQQALMIMPLLLIIASFLAWRLPFLEDK